MNLNRTRRWTFLTGLVVAVSLCHGLTVETDPPTVPVSPGPEPFTEEIFKARVFEESLIPIGGHPSVEESRALADALKRYSERKQPEDFSSFTAFLEKYPRSAWNTALLTGLGLKYYDAAYYSLALAAWKQASSLGHVPADLRGKLIADRAVCELAGLYSRLGRMDDLEALLKSVEQHVFLGGASERINLAREALWSMKNRPEVSFRCGPLAVQSIRRSLNPNAPLPEELLQSASTQRGLSFQQVSELANKVGLNYRIAFRNQGAPIVIPSVVHWKVGHFAAMLRLEAGRYFLEDPTFVNSAWATEKAIESEASGYFLIPADRELPSGWRTVTADEGSKVWGKGLVSGIDPDNYTPDDLQAGSCIAGRENMGMAIARVHLGLANLQIRDTPIGYTPPVGPPVYFTVRYNQRDYIFPPTSLFSLNGFGSKWTHDWYGFIRDNPDNALADVKYTVPGGGVRTFTGFNTNSQTFAPQQLDQIWLRRIGSSVATSTYEMVYPDGSKRVFGFRDAGTAKLTQVTDSAGNAVTLNWQGSRLASLTDAIGQVTTLSYEHPMEPGLITKITDPFGRFATFDYGSWSLDHDNNPSTSNITVYSLIKITDVIGIESQMNYSSKLETATSLTTPYGTTTFSVGPLAGAIDANRWVEIGYPDNSRERIEFNQSTNIGVGFSDPSGTVPRDMSTDNRFMWYRNTYYWDRNACAQGYGDYSKARLFHWLHTPNIATMAGILESTKSPLEGRVWYDYDGQSSPIIVGSTDKPRHIGRVLDDGSTQLYSYGYNQFGNVTNVVDPVGRKFSFVYATNGIDLLEIRQTRGTNNQLLFASTFNNQHCPITSTDAAGQTTTNTYNARGQLLTTTNPKGETTTYGYNANGYLISVDGPLPGAIDLTRLGYDAFGRRNALTNAGGYTLVFDYDALNRPTRVTHPDASFSQVTYDRLDVATIRDGAGQVTFFEYDNVRQMTKRTDPLGRVTRFQWCSCGGLGSLIDPAGRITEWQSDVQGRPVSKQYNNGSKINYLYENTTSRLRQIIDEKLQVTQVSYNRDNTLHSISYLNSLVPTPAVVYAYDTNYERVISMTDGTGTSLFSYVPITESPALGAGRLASLDGPLADDTITYSYDQLGRRIASAINGVATAISYDAAGRIIGETNALGSFTYVYEDGSRRLVSQTFPNGQVEERSYGNNFQDRNLQRITHRVGATPVSEFLYGYNIPAARISTWSQQVGNLSPSLHTFGYDSVDQLLSATVTNGGTLVNSFTYNYDPAANRLAEQAGPSNYTAAYNSLNQLSTSTALAGVRTNEWDAEDRLVAVNAGNERTEFTYDGFSRLTSIRKLVNGSEVSRRRFIQGGRGISEERNLTNAVTKRFFSQGMKLESGPVAGNYYYTQDHLGSIREVIDSSGNLRARYAYDPYGRRTKLTGDIEADHGFAGMFWSPEVNLSLTHFRAYDAELGRWLSRDPLGNAELMEGPNLYAYVANDPVNRTDPLGLGDFDAHYDAIRKRYPNNPELAERYIKKHAERQANRPMPRPTPPSPATPAPTKSPSGPGEITDYLGKGELQEVEKAPKKAPARRAPSRPPPSSPSFPGIGGVFTVILEAEMTILTMTDCNTVNGILGLVRQGKGGSVNAYQDQMLKEIADY